MSTQLSDPPKQERVRATREHSTPPSSPLPGGYTLLSPSLHSQCASSLSHNGIAEVGLPEHVASTTKSQTTVAYNERSLINTVGNTTSGLLSQCKLPDRSHITYHPSLSPSYAIISILKLFVLKAYLNSMAKHN